MISILDTINDFSNEVLSILFDEPIKIEFMVYKTSKTKEKIKPSIVYKLLYRGYEMDHVDQLSGGEGDRVSLAITCALFQFSKFPFLLLDEFASSLDLNTKEVAIKSLKTFLGIGGGDSKSVLCISHDTVEGIYDYIMKL
jgi:ABC-type hemin transport system ATPase subunit